MKSDACMAERSVTAPEATEAGVSSQSTSVHSRREPRTLTAATYDGSVAGGASPAVIVGAGPYGLAVAAHLRWAGIDARVYGEPMGFWRHQMPEGMWLRSAWEASTIADPWGCLSLEAFEAAGGRRLSRPIHLDDFVAYGCWYRRHVVPELDQRKVASIDLGSDGFKLLLEDGEPLHARRVVIATGPAPFPWCPPQFAGMSHCLVSHSAEHRHLGRFAGQRVAVVGGGQSALESAALLHEAGAEVQVIARAPRIHWLRGQLLRGYLGPARRLVYPPADVGPPGLNWVVAMPDLFRRLPPDLQGRIARRAIRPAGAAWLRPRLVGVPIVTGHTIVAATPARGGVRLTRDDGVEHYADHVMLATGYRVDVTRYGLLAPELAGVLQCTNGYPRLTAGFESSVPGLHFVGVYAAGSFGPLMRFVSGTTYTARALAHRVAGGARA